MKQFVTTILIFTLLAGCAQRMMSPTEKTQEQMAKETTEAIPEKGVEEKEEGITPFDQEMVKEEEMELAKTVPPSETYGKKEIIFEIEDILKDIHFDFDKYDIREEDKPLLKKVADWMVQNTGTQILIEGHCDERGTNEYNLALADKRAKATEDYLVSLGVTSSRIELISYGEEKPLCNEPVESCWSENRRSHFISFEGGVD